VDAVEQATDGKPQPLLNYWRLWICDALLVTAGLLYFLAAQYGTYEFFGVACLMALLPLIPVIVLVGGAGSTIFILTKVMIEKRALKAPAALALLAGPGLIFFVLFVLLGAAKSPERRLDYICLGKVPASASHVRVAGYSTFLREEWLAVFEVGQRDFQTMVAQTELAPADEFEFRKILDQSAFKNSKLFQSVPSSSDLPCFKRVFKPGEEHQRGRVFAVFDPGTSTAVVLRESRD
jgi:hypothetical protein